MVTGLNHLHHFNKYFILIAIFYVLFRSINGWLGRKPFTKADGTASLILMILADLQLTTGLIQYLFTSIRVKAAMADMGAAMKDSWLRYFGVEHITAMLLAIILIHVGRTAMKKAQEDNSKHKKLATFTGIALLIIMISLAPKGLLFQSLSQLGQ